MLTGGDKFVLRGGYARTHDYAFLNIALNIVSSFPYVASNSRSSLTNAFPLLQSTPPGVPAGVNPNTLTRTVVGEDFGRRMADQFSLEIQRQLAPNLALRIGYVGTFGKDLFQTLDGNPRQPFSWLVTALVSIRRAASSDSAPTKPNPGITRSRPASTSASATV